MPKIDIRNIDIEDLPEPKKQKMIRRKNKEENKDKLKKQIVYLYIWQEKAKKKHQVATLKKQDTLMFTKNLHTIEKDN